MVITCLLACWFSFVSSSFLPLLLSSFLPSLPPCFLSFLPSFLPSFFGVSAWMGLLPPPSALRPPLGARRRRLRRQGGPLGGSGHGPSAPQRAGPEERKAFLKKINRLFHSHDSKVRTNSQGTGAFAETVAKWLPFAEMNTSCSPLFFKGIYYCWTLFFVSKNVGGA